MAELYVTHSASPIMSAPQKTETIIIDVIMYFFERQHMLNDRKVAKATQSEKLSAKIVVNPSHAGAGGSKCSPPAGASKDAHIPAQSGAGGSKCFPTIGAFEYGHIPVRSGHPTNDAMSGTQYQLNQVELAAAPHIFVLSKPIVAHRFMFCPFHLPVLAIFLSHIFSAPLSYLHCFYVFVH
jgi:hypothetical protein